MKGVKMKVHYCHEAFCNDWNEHPCHRERCPQRQNSAYPTRTHVQDWGASHVHYCENTKAVELFPQSACSCGSQCTMDSLGQGQIELASSLCEAQQRIKELESQK